MTLSFAFAYDADGCTLRPAVARRGILGRLRSRPRHNLHSLPKEEREVAMAVARLRVLDRDGRHHKVDEDGIWLSHMLASELDARSAQTLGLPPLLSRFVFKAAMRGSVGSVDFRLDWWWERSGRTIPLRRTGAVIEGAPEGLMRIPAPIMRAISVAQTFDPSLPLPDHWLALGEFRRSLGIDHPDVELEGLLENIEIITCDRVGLDVDLSDDSRFDVLPFVSQGLAEDAQPSEADAAIHGAELTEFRTQAHRRGAQPAYRIAAGKFLILDRSAMPVVQAISDAAKRGPEERRFFIRNAERIIAEAVERQALADGRLNELMSPDGYAEALEREVGRAWAETKEWASRVIAIAEWARPVIDQMQGSGTNWLPASIKPELGELLGAIADNEVEPLLRELKRVQDQGIAEVHHRVGAVPTTIEVIEALMRRLEMIRRQKETDPPGDPKTVFLPVTHSNFWDNDFHAETRRRTAEGTTDLPPSIRTLLKPHQMRSFDWQVRAWRFGLPGILNADEQGLGKTLQTISFLTWLAERMAGNEVLTRPMLIVAPTSLLRTWEAEFSAHVAPSFWDDPVRLYGQHLAQWKTAGNRRRDIDDGVARLDLMPLVTSPRPRLAITTYQTLANYAVTFSTTDFAVAVFDEIQNLKNPVAMRSEAAKAVKADFRIGLTGTPVENATRDIWSIMDQLFPGALGPLAEFRRIFDVPVERQMRQLHAAIFTEQAGRPALGLRRMKKDAAADLPPKVRVLHPRIMPEVQALRYDEVRAKGGGIFALLHHIRRTSLHPGLIEFEAPGSFTSSSARVSAVMDILSAIKSKNERALVFVENRDVQAWFAELVKIEFGLDRVYVINGDTGIDARRELTERFQSHLIDDRGFDVLIMGPRAAGTGLTLTAANHVIHLTRWWNPAVEEQCNDRTHRIGQTRAVTVHIPLAVHPRLGRNSFDCLLQRLMQRKRGVAEAVLWPQESPESELLTLYSSVLGAEEPKVAESEGLRLADRPDLLAAELRQGVIRVTPSGGGSSVVVAQGVATDAVLSLASEQDAAVIVMGSIGRGDVASERPLSLLPDQALWPDYVLPE